MHSKLILFSFADGILCLGVRFNLIDVVKKGNSHREEIKPSSTNSTTRVEQTVSSMMGSRFLSGLTRVSIDLTPAIQDSQDKWSVEGLISKAPALTARDGSVAREAQFFSISGRPVELPKVSRAIGDAWRAFEGIKKRPACVLCFSLPNNEYDVNLSPDSVIQPSPMTNQVEHAIDTPMSEMLPLSCLQRDRASDEDRLRWASLQSLFNNDSRHHQQDKIQALKMNGNAQHSGVRPLFHKIHSSWHRKRLQSHIMSHPDALDVGGTFAVEAVL
jgi:DNA mismatch repair ATPase MutL